MNNHFNENKRREQLFSILMSIEYFTDVFGLVHLLRLLTLLLLIIVMEIKFVSSCPFYLNEFLGFNHSSILFYYILIWISLAFEIYFLLNRLLVSRQTRARKSTIILDILLAIGFALAACFTLYAFVQSKPGYLITQEDFIERILPLSESCNRQRWFGIVGGFCMSLFYLLASVLLLYRWKI